MNRALLFALPLVAAAAGLVVWLFTRDQTRVGLGTEVRAQLAGLREQRLLAEAESMLGAERAREELGKGRAAEFAKLTERDRAAAEVLRSDPVALSRFLVRAAGRKP